MSDQYIDDLTETENYTGEEPPWVQPPPSSGGVQECNYSKPCPEGYTCYGETDCGLGPDGPIECPPEVKALWDNKCHMECGYDSDSECPDDMPVCREVLISDYTAFLCFG